MSDVSILKEFLVAVGFKVDNAQYAKMQERIKQVTTAVTEMAAAVSVAVEAVRIGVADMNGQLESLYYSSQRIDSSVEKINAFGYAVSQMGGDAKSAQQSIENLVEKMKENPGARGLLNGLGVATPLNPDGTPKDGVKVMRDLSKVLQTMDYRIAVQRANQLGIDLNTLQAIRRGELDKGLADYDRLSKDADQQKAAAGAHAFMVQWRRLGAEFNIFAGLIAERWAPIIGAAADALTGLINVMITFDKVTGGITTLLVSAAAVMASMATAAGIVGKILGAGKGGVAAGLGEVEGAAIPLVARLGTLAAVLGRLAGAALIISGIIAAAGLLSGAGGTPKDIDDIEGAAKDPTKADDKTLASAIDFFRKQVAAAPPQYAGKDKQILAALIQEQARRLKGRVTGAMTAAGVMSTPTGSAPAAPGPWGAGEPGTVADRIRAAIAYFRGKGLTPEQATGFVANLLGENSTLDPHRREKLRNGQPGPGYGLEQLTAQKRLQDFKSWAGHAVYGTGWKEQLDFIWHELTAIETGPFAHLKAARTAAQAAAAGVLFERPHDPEGERRRRGRIADQLMAGNYSGTGGSQLAFAQRTTIIVQGGGEASAVGKAVASEQTRVNGDLVRSLKGTVR